MVIHIDDVSWVRDGATILKDVNWTVEPGEHWCIVGLNGSGKTTLLNMINGYIWPTKGSVSVLGKKFGEYDLRELRKSIGWVSSSLQQRLYGGETAINIVLSGKYATIGLYDKPDEDALEQAHDLLRLLGCEKLANRTYNTFSQGERQRVLIARALIAAPKLLILDEPCTGLDVFARELLLRMVERIAQQPNAPTLLFVTHHIEEIMPVFNRTLLVKQGEIFGAGPTQDILNTELLSRFFDAPLEVEHRNDRAWLHPLGVIETKA
ncbi:ABC transporter ATP-binding protein [Paenibacillus sp. MMS18-CY102]|uniref:ABC transporter ATP-binding protein n=1 Tax=Paenibacillus sp. MMS18-CY102 TaxID=2682849 RepID=UPI00136647B4|nr:ABC transporter ATP-binding protein [Paenibacillus sp. MMS18-CY102]MWC28038.1 ATP-binding cassette domain-containing protein [Paenibacillus sp. MMS18-CY102]